MEPPLIRCVPKTYYWFIGICLYPIAGFIFTAVLIRPFLLLFDYDLTKSALVFTWIAVGAIISVWAYTRDYHRLCYVLNADSIEIGRGSAANHIPFYTIDSIVLALPDQLPWWVRIQRFNPKGRDVYRNIIHTRRNTLLLRLNGSRYLPLNVNYSFLDDGETFMHQFLHLNREKIVGTETYTAREIEGLRSAVSNTMKTIV